MSPDLRINSCGQFSRPSFFNSRNKPRAVLTSISRLLRGAGSKDNHADSMQSPVAAEYSRNAGMCVDLRGKSNHPLALVYAEIFTHALVDAPLAHGRIQPFYRLDDAPYCVALALATRDGVFDATACKCALEASYRDFRPATVAEWYSLDSHESKFRLAGPPWAAVPPWRARSQYSYASALLRAAEAELARDGIEIDSDETGLIWGKCGPVHPILLDHEVTRIGRLYHSIRQQGYKRHDGEDGDIRATALVDRNHQWRWLVTGGYHRAAVLRALDYISATVRITKVVDIAHAAYWPHIRDGLYTQQEAESVFLKMFNGSDQL